MIKTEENLYRQFHKCMKLMHKCHHGGHGHRGQGKLLSLLLKQDGLSHKEIVQALDVRPSTESELVAKLEQAGYVYKAVNEADKRVTNVYLTDAGRAVAEQMLAERLDAGQNLFKVLSEEEQAQLSVLMEKLSTSLMEQVSQMSEEAGKRGNGWRGHRGSKHHHHGKREDSQEDGHHSREHGDRRSRGRHGEHRGGKYKHNNRGHEDKQRHRRDEQIERD